MSSNTLSGKTTVCGVIGDPIEHTMSPVMHNAAFRKMGLDYIYLPFRVRQEELNQAVNGMRALNIRGLNITLPHKVSIIPLLDKLDLLAKEIGAVNTIVNNDGILTGYNTDAYGALQALLESGVEPEAKNVVILGAGGASRAIAIVLAQRGANLVILNRQLELDWAQDLSAQISRAYKEAKALELNDDNLAKALENASVLINATSVGMSPDADATPVPARFLRPSLVVFDIVYNPLKTRLLKEAEASGARTIAGLDMLIWQGASAFEKWTGRKAPIDLMKREVIKVLAKHED